MLAVARSHLSDLMADVQKMYSDLERSGGGGERSQTVGEPDSKARRPDVRQSTRSSDNISNQSPLQPRPQEPV
jgi:hypothetical protein